MVYVNGVLSEILCVPPVTPPRVPHGEGRMRCGFAGGCRVGGGGSSGGMGDGFSDATPSPGSPLRVLARPAREERIGERFAVSRVR